MQESRYRFWDIAIKMLTIAAVMISVSWALYEHFDAEKQRINSVFWSKRLDLYLRTSEVTGRIANARSSDEVEQECAEFWQLYHGPMTVIEDESVKIQMERFAGVVRTFQGPSGTSRRVSGQDKPVSTEFDGLEGDELHRTKKDVAKQLADAMRQSLENWGKPFAR